MVAKTKIEVALGDPDPKADSSTYTWSDWTVYVELDGGSAVQIFRGYRDGAEDSSATEIRFRGKNADKRWSLNNPNNPFYGQIIKRRTPIRVSRVDGGTFVRAFGILEESIRGSSANGAYRFADIVAYGRLHALEEQPAGNSVLYDQLTTGDASAHVVAYWPGEDPSGATRLVSAVPGQPDITSMANITPSGDADVLGSGPLWTIPDGGYVIASIRPYARLYPERWGVMLVVKFPDEPSGTISFLAVYPSSGTIWRWVLQIVPGSPAVLGVRAENTSGTNLLTGTTTTAFLDLYGNEPWGKTVGLQLRVAQNGTGIDWGISVTASADAFDTALGQLGTVASQTNGPINLLSSAPVPGLAGTWTSGHWAVFNEPTSMDFASFNGLIGQSLTNEFLSAAIDAKVDGDLSGTTDSTTGARPVARAIERMRLASRSEGGLMFEKTNGAITIMTRSALQNQAVALTINRNSQQIAALLAVDDMQSQSNRVTASNAVGSTIIADAPVPYDPTTVGWVRDAPVTVNLADDAQLLGAAQLEVAQRSYPESRYLLTLYLDGPASGLKATYLSSVDIGSRIQITNPPTFEVLDTIDQQVMGITERLSEKEYEVSLNTRPAAIWQVMTCETGAGNVSRADTAGCVLLAALTDVGTSAIVATNGTPGEFAAKLSTTSLPYDLALRTYDRVTCTAVTNNAPTFVAAGTSAAADYAAVTPGVPAGMTVGDGLFLLAAVRGTGGFGYLTGVAGRRAEVTGDQLGWTTLAKFGGVNGSFRLYGRTYESGFAAPTLTPFGGAAGDTVIAQMAGFRYTQPLAHTAAIPLANAAAGNIAYPLNGIVRTGTVSLLCLQKDDDWTSVTAPAGFTKIGDPFSTLGSDIGIAWFYKIETTPGTDIAAGTATVVGGASAISLATVVTVCGDAQTLTLTRAVNGAVTAHPAGSDVRLWRAGRAAR